MATLYEIDQAILDCIDAETGEIVDPEKLNELQMERGEKIEKVACLYKNLLSDADAMKAEINALSEREKAARQKAESLKGWLSGALNGSGMSTPKVAITFRRSEAIEIDDDEKFVDWADLNNRDDLLTYKNPSPNKIAIKQEFKNEPNLKSFGGAHLIIRNNISIK